MRKFKNIRLRKSPIVLERVIMINRIIKETITESFNSIIETQYDSFFDGDIEIYRFKTNSDNSYDLEFITNIINKNTSLNDGSYLKDYLADTEDVLVKSVDIAFVPSEINMDDRDNHELYTKEINRGETFELMGRISYLINRYIKNNPDNKVYVIGKNTKETKLNMYNNMFSNLFNHDYFKLEGDNYGYDEGSYYFIKKD
jgi:hypothetical protein